jgi:hypothetical protein
MTPDAAGCAVIHQSLEEFLKLSQVEAVSLKFVFHLWKWFQTSEPQVPDCLWLHISPGFG